MFEVAVKERLFVEKVKVDSLPPEMVKRATWRTLLRISGTGFLAWLRKSGRERERLELIASQLADFLIMRISRISAEWPEAPIEFWTRIPEVRSCCSDPQTFEKPLAVEAYAYVHLLERYRRMWRCLKYLTQNAALPLGTHGVRVLDVGAGPAPSLYAIGDFYRALNEYAREANLPDLQLQKPELNCIERSQPMIHFFHEFSEFCGHSGPFREVFSDFRGLDLGGSREWYRNQNEIVTVQDPETGDYEEILNPDAGDSANRLYRYRLLVFSNFLTLESDVDLFQEELRRIFGDLSPGAVVVALGATGGVYPQIYKRVVAIAKAAGLKQAAFRDQRLELHGIGNDAAATIKQTQHRVYLFLESLVGSRALTRRMGNVRWPDYWTSKPSPKYRPVFALRIFRRGRWPTRRNNS